MDGSYIQAKVTVVYAEVAKRLGLPHRHFRPEGVNRRLTVGLTYLRCCSVMSWRDDHGRSSLWWLGLVLRR